MPSLPLTRDMAKKAAVTLRSVAAYIWKAILSLLSQSHCSPILQGLSSHFTAGRVVTGLYVSHILSLSRRRATMSDLLLSTQAG